ncbi:MAG: RluA family pseudouridine synthase [Candidatus Brocadiae bacterium]|nr:RluA family pseudouridine synthase [Candidatus Brocadiia bacterium]
MEGRRLDAYLGKRFFEYSRSYLQKLIKNGNVLIDGKEVKPGYKIKEGQKIFIRLPELEPLHLKPQEMELDIIFEDEHIAVINKRADLVVHPSRGHMEGTLVNGLIHYFENLSDFNDAYRPGIVHRLDRFTSGLLVIAKNNKSHAALAEQFQTRHIHKEYLALVEGKVRFENGTISLPLGIDPRNRERAAVCHGGKEAVTDYQVIARYPSFTFVHVFPKTGRTHQIRIHMKSQGNPIVCDSLYDANPILDKARILANVSGSVDTEDQDEVLMDRTALHAWRIHFEHPATQQEMHLTAPPAQDFLEALKFLETLWPNPKVAELIEKAGNKT